MFRKALGTGIFLALAVSLAFSSTTPPAKAKLSAADIVDKNVAARGGLQAWRAVQAISFSGKMAAGGNQRATLPASPTSRRGLPSLPQQRPVEEAQLPFLMELKRGRKMRLELQFNGQTALQVFDGSNGWKLRPYLNRLEVEPYTADEIKASANQAELDGQLIDYLAKGTKIELDAVEKVNDRDNYKLKLTFKNGNVIHVWVDGETFLETKMDGEPRRLDGAYHPVEIWFSDYRPVSGLQIPFMIETKVLPLPKMPGRLAITEKIAIEEVVVNPKLADTLFAKPAVASSKVDAKSAPPIGAHSLP